MPKYGRVKDSHIKVLEDIVGSEKVSTRPEELYCYSRDSTIFKYRPDVVVRPENSAQVSEILKVANEDRIPVTPRGSGTSAAGLPLPVYGGILLDMSSMNKIELIDVENQIAIVQPGVVCDVLNERLREYGFFFPPDPASSPICTIGGMVNTNASGNRTMKYGPTRNYVLWLEVVLANGKIIHTGSKTLKSVSDYDLTRLFVGSEGSLGVVTKVGLKVVPLPESVGTAIFIFDSVDKLVRAATKVRLSGIVPEMLEFMDRRTTSASFDYAGIKDVPEGNFLLLDLGERREAVEPLLEKVVSICNSENPEFVDKTLDLEYRENLIKARKAALPALSRLRPSTAMEDCTVPLTKLPEAAVKVEKIPEDLGVEGFDLGNFGHIGDGNMHPTFVFDEREEEQRKALFKAIDILYQDIVLPLGGSVTAEHGIGLTRAKYVALEHPSTVGLMRSLKRLFDPNLILNPGKGKGGPLSIEEVGS
ncbi:FAD-binding oxidoreductase [Candidatus Bathyarchaeota archaeon]|nr:MAG: FAD-binding oxidoreductase [Candidatus Bathyarchaeota archaeon]